MFNADKAYIQSTFKDLDQIDKSNRKYLKISEPALGDLSTCKDKDLEDKLFATIEKATKKMWTDKHKSDGFGAEANAIDATEAGVMPVNELTDIFSYVASSRFEEAAKKVAIEKKDQGDKYEEPEGLKEKLKGLEA